MKAKDKFIAGVKSGFQATFHKGTVLGKMGYLHDELEVIGNNINYLGSVSNLMRICDAKDPVCQTGIDAFSQKKYKKAYRLFKQIPPYRISERNYTLAVCNIYGKGTPKNIDKGFELAKKGSDVSLCCKQLLARCYIEGVGVPINKKKAYELLMEVLSRINISQESDLNEDYLLPDIYYFCGEYELENGDTDKGLEHLRVAATEKDYGMAYYLLGKYYYESEPEKAKLYFDKAKKLNVNVSAFYYAEERETVSETPLDSGASEKIDSFSNTVDSFVNIYEKVQQLDPEEAMKNHYDKKRERIKAQSDVKKQRAVSYNDIETTRLKSQTEKWKAERENKKMEKKVDKENKKMEKIDERRSERKK